MKRVLFPVLFTVFAIILAVSETPKLTELARLRMLNSYRKVAQAQTELIAAYQGLCQKDAACTAKQKEFDQKSNDFRAVQDQAVKEAGLPAGTQFNLNVATDEVTPVIPEKK